jgi:hypothetical protein
MILILLGKQQSGFLGHMKVHFNFVAKLPVSQRKKLFAWKTVLETPSQPMAGGGSVHLSY